MSIYVYFREEKNQHKCPNEQRPCKASSIGCPFIGTLANVAKHEQECPVAQLHPIVHPLHAKLDAQAKQIAELVDIVRALATVTKRKDQELLELRQLVLESSKTTMDGVSISILASGHEGDLYDDWETKKSEFASRFT
jgi:hypothetical protein